MHVRARFTQAPADAGQCTAGTDPSHERIGCFADICRQLRQDFRCGFRVVGAPVVGVGVLVAIPVALGLFRCQAVGFAQGEIVAFDGVGDDELRAVGLYPLQSLLARVARHHDGDRDAERRAEHGVGDARVAGGGIEQPAAASEAAGADGLGEHAGDRAVLDRAPRVHALQFREKPCLGRDRTHQIDLHQGRVADAGEQAAGILTGNSFSFHAITLAQNCS